MPLLLRSSALGLLFAGAYYFNFFLWLSGGGLYLSVGYRRADLLLATLVLWAVATLAIAGALWLAQRLPEGLPGRAGRALVTVVLAAAFVRCYAKMAGVGLANPLEAQGGLQLGLPWLAAGAVAAWAVLTVRPAAVPRLLAFMATAGVLTLPVAALRMVQTPVGATGAEAPHVAARADAPAAPAPRRAVWVVFDEFDPQVAFESAWGPSPELPRFRELLAHAVVATRAAAPSDNTDVSLPAMLTGQRSAGNRYGKPGELTVLGTDGSATPFRVAHTVFARVPGGPGASSVLGFYHPYCEVLSPLADCVSYTTRMGTRWYDGLGNAFPRRLLGLKDPMTEITEQQLALLPRFIGNDRLALTFVHLNLPHLPAHVAAARFSEAARGEAGQYKQNLRLSDEVLGGIRRDMARATPRQAQLLVLSSDHGFRRRPQPGPHPALFVVKLSTDDSPLTLTQPIESHHLQALVLEFLDGRLSSHADIARWLQQRPPPAIATSHVR
jgi:hypothetical protein